MHAEDAADQLDRDLDRIGSHPELRFALNGRADGVSQLAESFRALAAADRDADPSLEFLNNLEVELKMNASSFPTKAPLSGRRIAPSAPRSLRPAAQAWPLPKRSRFAFVELAAAMLLIVGLVGVAYNGGAFNALFVHGDPDPRGVLSGHRHVPRQRRPHRCGSRPWPDRRSGPRLENPGSWRRPKSAGGCGQPCLLCRSRSNDGSRVRHLPGSQNRRCGLVVAGRCTAIVQRCGRRWHRLRANQHGRDGPSR